MEETTGPHLGDGMGAYLRLLRHGPAGRPFIAAFIARLPISMAPLGILLLIEHDRGTYAIAGLVTGAYALGSAAGTPLWGRLMDRFGQVPILLPTSLGSAGLLAALALCTVGGAPTPVLLACSVAAGLTYPPISPAIRSAYRIILPDPAARRVAFALDATSVELLFVGGPLLLSVLLALTPPVAPLLVTAGFMAGGGVAYCRTDAARRWRPGSAELGPPDRRHVGRRSALTAPGVAAVLAVMLTLSIGFGQLDTSMAATAGERLGGTDRVGLLFAAIAGGSTIGGLAFGTRRWPFDERRAVAVLLALFAAFLAAHGDPGLVPGLTAVADVPAALPHRLHHRPDADHAAVAAGPARPGPPAERGSGVPVGGHHHRRGGGHRDRGLRHRRLGPDRRLRRGRRRCRPGGRDRAGQPVPLAGSGRTVSDPVGDGPDAAGARGLRW